MTYPIPTCGEALLPCPFCGNESPRRVRATDGNTFEVHCGKLDCQAYQEDAEAWNRRAPPKGTAEPVGYSLGERLFRALNGERWSSRIRGFQDAYEQAATRFIASLTYAERVGTQQALLESVLVEALRPFAGVIHAVTDEGSPEFRDWIKESKDFLVIFSFAGQNISLGDLRRAREALALASRLTGERGWSVADIAAPASGQCAGDAQSQSEGER